MKKAELYRQIFRHLYSANPLPNQDELRFQIAVCCFEVLKDEDENLKDADNIALTMADAFIASFKKFLNSIDYLPDNFEGDIVKHIKHRDSDTCVCILRPLSWFASTVENADKFSLIRMDSLTRL